MVELIEGSDLMLNISNFPWAEFAMSENRVEYINDSLSLKRNRRSTGAMRYELELVTVDMDMAQGRRIKAQLSRAKDTNDLLSFIHPRLSYTQGTTPVGNLSTSVTLAGANTVQMQAGDVWQLMAGDYIQFLSHTKVYEVAEDTLLQSGTQNVKLTSTLRQDIATGVDGLVTINDVPFFLDVDGVIEFSTEASEGQDMQITLVAVERL